MPYVPPGKTNSSLAEFRAITPEREHASPGNLVRYKDQLAVQHATARYRFSRPAERDLPTMSYLIMLILSPPRHFQVGVRWCRLACGDGVTRGRPSSQRW